jgi:uncharacterized membrane protein YkgB
MNYRNIDTHILSTAGTMIGICLTVISILKIAQLKNGFITLADEILAFDAWMFLLSATFSYLSIRSKTTGSKFEIIADKLFISALIIMCIAIFIITVEVM